ncbi:hypothetical protein AB1286_22635 [Trinickia sp. NRRL B-1857]|uniref:hypothetical protein n=1 Tax=Trinickia sp. NRRL B-1857 TaxID=3162879 RepID=UPI003D2C1E4E
MRTANFFDPDAVTRQNGPNNAGGSVMEGKIDRGEFDDGFDVGHGSGMGKKDVSRTAHAHLATASAIEPVAGTAFSFNARKKIAASLVSV